jgi:hypothetical protein
MFVNTHPKFYIYIVLQARTGPLATNHQQEMGSINVVVSAADGARLPGRPPAVYSAEARETMMNRCPGRGTVQVMETAVIHGNSPC